MPTQLRNQTSCHSVATGISPRNLQIAHRNSLITPSVCPGSHKNCWLHGAKGLTTSCQCMPAIGKIQSTWDSPQSLILERFLWTILMSKSKFWANPQNFELIPFRCGRQICPRLPLAIKMLHVILVHLLTLLIGSSKIEFHQRPCVVTIKPFKPK